MYIYIWQMPELDFWKRHISDALYNQYTPIEQ